MTLVREAWLGYRPRRDLGGSGFGREILIRGTGAELETARRELSSGLERMLGARRARTVPTPQKDGFVYVATAKSLEDAGGPLKRDDALGPEDYRVVPWTLAGRRGLLVVGGEAVGALYGAFALLRALSLGEDPNTLDLRGRPGNPLRMLNHWDNLDGSIERGYAGRSIFFRNGRVLPPGRRIREYARLIASVGVNAVAINNVNVHREETQLLVGSRLAAVARLADVLRRYGIRLYLSVNFAAPIELGGLGTADPLDAEVAAWWKARTAEIYDLIPDFGGFVVKADSEFRPGPHVYGRTHADGANMLADALAGHGGRVIWRAFVYNCLTDWRDRKLDRAKAAYENFTPLDGRFRDNVAVQIKNGPMDFQVREPASPLFGALKATNQMLEVQITQEYTGQQRHLFYWVPTWKAVLDFDTHALGEGSLVADVVSGARFDRPWGGMAGVANIGDSPAWTGHPLAQANLYGFGRLAWDPELSARRIAEEWARLSLGSDPDVVRTVVDMLMASPNIYERYTAPLGVGWMVNPGHHYGPNVDGYEYSKWGTYHFADREGIGVDRTMRTGTGYTAQYHEPIRSLYESLETCPDELLLFFHHVPYLYRLRSGKTVLQHVYDTHFQGAEQAEELLQAWNRLGGLISDDWHGPVRERLEEQAAHAKEWRDVINTYFYRRTGTPDAGGRTIHS